VVELLAVVCQRCSCHRIYSVHLFFHFSSLSRYNLEEHPDIIEALVYSARYLYDPPSLDTFLPVFQFALWVTDFFQFPYNPEQVQTRANEFNTTSESSTADNSPGSPVRRPPAAMDNAAPRIMQALEALAARRPVLTVKPYDGHGQDPVEWLNEYERVAAAHGFNNDTKLAMVGTYLRGDAASWLAGINLQGWVAGNGVATNQAFKPVFLQRFQTPTKILQWHLELDKHWSKWHFQVVFDLSSDRLKAI